MRVASRTVVLRRWARGGNPWSARGRALAALSTSRPALVATPTVSPAGVAAALDGAVELPGLLAKADSMRIRKILESDVRHTMSLQVRARASARRVAPSSGTRRYWRPSRRRDPRTGPRLTRVPAAQEYLKVCERNGLPEDEARSLLRDLHRVGVVFHFHNVRRPPRGALRRLFRPCWPPPRSDPHAPHAGPVPRPRPRTSASGTWSSSSPRW